MRFALFALALGCSSPSEEPVVVADTATANDTAAIDTSTPSDSAVADTAVTETGDTWESFAKGFFAKYCVECHGATSTTRKYTAIDDVKRDSAKIKCGTASTKLAGCGSFPPPKQFPISNAAKSNPKPTDSERDRLVAWIDAGLP